jgi:hypothetical protein
MAKRNEGECEEVEQNQMERAMTGQNHLNNDVNCTRPIAKITERNILKTRTAAGGWVRKKMW